MEPSRADSKIIGKIDKWIAQIEQSPVEKAAKKKFFGKALGLIKKRQLITSNLRKNK